MGIKFWIQNSHMQTNKEFIDALDIPSEDSFLAVAVRRTAAWQLGKSVVELETSAVEEPDFLAPWDRVEFLIRIENELQRKLSINKTPLPGDERIPLDWFRGPAIKMPMGEWTKIAIKQFLEPIRSEIHCPANWTLFESEDLPSTEQTWTERFWNNFLVSSCIAPFVLIFLTLPGCFFSWWANNVSKLCVIVLICWPWIFYIILRIRNRFFPNHANAMLKKTVTKLLGTVTFHANTLYFFDDESLENHVEILPDDYRFFLIYGTEDFDRPSYAVLSNQKEIPDFDTVLDIITESEDKTQRQKIEIVMDSGLVSFADVADLKQLLWKPEPNSKTVKEVLLRENGNVAGLKLYPSYGDGGYRVYVRKDGSQCDIVLELITLEEWEPK